RLNREDPRDRANGPGAWPTKEPSAWTSLRKPTLSTRPPTDPPAHAAAATTSRSKSGRNSPHPAGSSARSTCAPPSPQPASAAPYDRPPRPRGRPVGGVPDRRVRLLPRQHRPTNRARAGDPAAALPAPLPPPPARPHRGPPDLRP